MAFGFLNLPKAKWWTALRQVILKSDFQDIETALLEAHGLINPPTLTWVDVTSVKVPATADCPAAVLMSGFPNILHPGAFVSGALSDGKYRVNVADTTMDFDVAASLWGTEKVSQWYALYAIAANVDAVFTLKAMPFMRVKSQASQVISLGTLTTPATGIGYGFTTDELVGGMVYVLSGASKGLMRAITANNNDNSTGGTITYSGTALTLAQGDVFIVLPPATNFRFLGAIYNDTGSNIGPVYSCFGEQKVEYNIPGTQVFIVPPGIFLLKEIVVVGAGGFGYGAVYGGGGGGAVEIYGNYPVIPGQFITIVVGTGGTLAIHDGGISSFDTLPSAAGGIGAGTGGAASVVGCKYRTNQAAGYDGVINQDGGDSGLYLARGGCSPPPYTAGSPGGGGYYNTVGGPGAVYISY